MLKKNIIKGLATAVLMVAMTAGVAAAAVSTVTVSGDTASGENQPGWLFNRDASTSTPYSFTTDQASIGLGSLYVQPIGATAMNKFVGENFLNTAIASVNSISYDFMIGTGGESSDEEQFYMNVYANFGSSDDLKFYDCRYNVVPSTGSTSSFTTVTFDPTQAYPVTQRATSPFTCPAIPAEMETLSAGSNFRMFALNVGDTSANDEGLDGYLDKVVVSTVSDVTTSDFEPTPSPTPSPSPSVSPTPVPMPVTKDDCKKGGWMSFFPFFKNQGDCVSSTVKNSNSNK
ncbi:MAG: hypothetical protein M3Q81_03565 [bacterium]|nr:hypothetical protein [bacterium]